MTRSCILCGDPLCLCAYHGAQGNLCLATRFGVCETDTRDLARLAGEQVVLIDGETTMVTRTMEEDTYLRIEEALLGFQANDR